MIIPTEIIQQKRNGGSLSSVQLREFIRQYVAGNIPDYQMSALLMAIFFRGLDADELVTLVRTMRDSGKVLHLSDITGFKIDKHSTGGVGDKISLILAPLLACLGIIVPMISGRGLGHTGGTLDKLESIPGLQTRISLTKFKRILREVGFVIAGQTDEIVPADRRIYALRDATATVESLPLVVSSILSKKLAEDLDGLILDVKTGTGAFFPKQEDAIQLASRLIAVGEDFGIRVRALLTRMDQPVGVKVGNWLEVCETVACLQGKGPTDTMFEVYALALLALRAAGFTDDSSELLSQLKQAISSGAAMERFLLYVRLIGGDIQVIENTARCPLPPAIPIIAVKSGFVTELNAYQIGIASALAGAGRQRAEDSIDPVAGIHLHAKIGVVVQEGEVLAEIYTHKRNTNEICKLVSKAFSISAEKLPLDKIIIGEVTRNSELKPFNELV